MKKVCFVGVRNIFFEKALLKFLTDYIYVSENEVKIGSLNSNGLLIYDTGGYFKDIGTDFEAIVFKNDFFEPFEYRSRIKPRCVVFLTEGCPRIAKKLDELGIRYNVCGVERSCGITPSSITEDSLTVSLRSVVTSSGRVICEGDEFRINGLFNVYNICPAMVGSTIERIICGYNFAR